MSTRRSRRLECATMLLGTLPILGCPFLPCSGTGDRLLTDITLVRSGGVGRFLDEVTVRVDGAIEIQGQLLGHGDATMSDADMATLLDLLSGWCRVRDPVEGSDECCDQFSYSVTYNGMQVDWTAFTVRVPSGLWQISEFLLKLAETPAQP